MKTYEFSATTDLGGDGATYFEVELTEEEAALLEKIGREAVSDGYEFNECEDLNDLYSKVYAVAVDVLTEELREYEEFDEDDEEADEWTADMTYSITIHFPDSFEE